MKISNNRFYNDMVYNFMTSPSFEKMSILIAMTKIAGMYEIIFETKLNGDMTDDLSWWDELYVVSQEAIIKIIDLEITDNSIEKFKNFVDNLKINHLLKLVKSHNIKNININIKAAE